MDAEQQNQKRRHQRAAAHTRHPDEQTDGKSGNSQERIDH
jgi:hypothetical protein